MTTTEYLIVGAIVALIGLVSVAMYSSSQDFKAACAATGGVTVHDGRQYQCFRTKL